MNYDLATEHLSYAQGTPDVKRAMREIELISERSAGDRELFVAYDDQSSWPFVWYLRDYPKSRTWGTQAQFAQGAAVIITGPKNRDGAWPLVADGYVKREYRLIWWPVQEYSNKGPRDLVQLLRDPVRRHQLWRMAMYHDYSHMDAVKWDPRQDFEMYVRDDVAPLGLAALGLGDTAGAGSAASSASAPAVGGSGTRLEPQPRAIFTGPFDGLALAGPTDIAIAPDGARVIADAGNHRIVVLERDGTLRRAFGGKCDISQAASSGCVDPDGAGPLELGDGQFNEPWGVAVGPSGQIFVSDTWNHRIERFDSSGRFSGKWGRFGNNPVAGGAPAEEPIFYGPRGISDGFDGELVVSDTGNKRLLVFSPEGGLLRTIGNGGAGPEQWNEPVGIAADQNGTLLVADTWNRRVKRLDRRYAAIANWRVPDWRSESVSDKPFVAADDNGMVYAGDPAGGRVWIFAPSGRLEGTLVLPALVAGKPRPLGMAIDGAAGELLVVDQSGGRVLVYALPNLRTAQAQS
jgi:sugar lactone lactonase YvrE